MNPQPELSLVPSTPALDPELATLEQLEAIIEAGKDVSRSVGLALAAIKDRKLYKKTHASFELYVEERWGRSYSSAWRQIGQVKAQKALPPGSPKPSQEPGRKRPDRRRKQNLAGHTSATPLTREDESVSREVLPSLEPSSDPTPRDQAQNKEVRRLRDLLATRNAYIDELETQSQHPSTTPEPTTGAGKMWAQEKREHMVTKQQLATAEAEIQLLKGANHSKDAIIAELRSQLAGAPAPRAPRAKIDSAKKPTSGCLHKNAKSIGWTVKCPDCSGLKQKDGTWVVLG